MPRSLIGLATLATIAVLSLAVLGGCSSGPSAAVSCRAALIARQQYWTIHGVSPEHEPTACKALPYSQVAKLFGNLVLGGG